MAWIKWVETRNGAILLMSTDWQINAASQKPSWKVPRSSLAAGSISSPYAKVYSLIHTWHVICTQICKPCIYRLYKCSHIEILVQTHQEIVYLCNLWQTNILLKKQNLLTFAMIIVLQYMLQYIMVLYHVSLAVPNPQDPMMFLFASLLTTVNKILGAEGAFLLQATLKNKMKPELLFIQDAMGGQVPTITRHIDHPQE